MYCLEFFVCCLILGLEYLHRNNVIHRDIKPENLVLDEKGYLRITDFGIAKLYQKDNANETSGTPGYMSPEVILGKNHNCAVDYFALGVITYEFMMGCRPYNGKNRREIREKIIAKQVKVNKNDIPFGWSMEAAHFINGLLQRKPANRLGLRGALEVKENAWLKYYQWKDLYEKKLEAPFIPQQGDNFDQKYCGNDNKIDQETKIRYEMILKDPLYKDAFLNFTFFGEYTDEIKGKKGKHTKGIRQQNGDNLISGEFINPHKDIKNYLDKQLDKTIINLKNHPFNESIFQGSSLLNSSVEEKRTPNLDLEKGFIYKDLNNVDKTSQLEKKIIKIKQQSVSCSTSTLLRGYKRGQNSSSFLMNSSVAGYLKNNNIQSNITKEELPNNNNCSDSIIDDEATISTNNKI